MAWNKLGTTTLGSAGDELQVSGLSSNQFNIILDHIFSSGNAVKKLNFNNDGVAGSSYAYRRSPNGASDSTTTSTGYIDIWHNQTDDHFGLTYLFADSSEEKLLMFVMCSNGGTGAGNAPNRREVAGKEVTNDALTQVDIDNDSTGDFAADSNISAIGSDGTVSLNVQDGAIYYDTDLNKEYVLYNDTWTEI